MIQYYTSKFKFTSFQKFLVSVHKMCIQSLKFFKTELKIHKEKPKIQISNSITKI
jgi:hypothetical protein